MRWCCTTAAATLTAAGAELAAAMVAGAQAAAAILVPAEAATAVLAFQSGGIV
jgi:hypothetical protein